MEMQAMPQGFTLINRKANERDQQAQWRSRVSGSVTWWNSENKIRRGQWQKWNFRWASGDAWNLTLVAEPGNGKNLEVNTAEKEKLQVFKLELQATFSTSTESSTIAFYFPLSVISSPHELSLLSPPVPSTPGQQHGYLQLHTSG